MKRSLYLVAVALVALSLLAGCASATPAAGPTKPASTATSVPAAAATKPAAAATSAPTSAATPAPAAKIKRGGTLIRMDTAEVSSWDPLFSVQSSQFIESPAFEAPLRYTLVDRATQKFELKPELAESWEVVNPTTITMKFRKGVKFHDGSELTAEVAKWNLDRARTDPKSLAKSFFESIEKIDVVDAQTIKITLSAPSATQLLNMTKAPGGTGGMGSFMVSKEAFEKLGAEAVSKKPYATGPYTMEQWLKDDRTTYKKFDGYWDKGADGQALPYLDSIVVRTVRDQTVALMELRAGTGHVMKSVPGKDIASVKSNADLVFDEWPWSGVPLDFGWNPVKPLWQNLKLRQAAQYAIDRETMSKALGFGSSIPDFHFHWVPAWPGYDETLPHFNFDLNKAQQLMKEAGYPNGVDGGNFDFVTGGSGPRDAEMLQQMWAKIGLKVNLRGFDSVTHKELVKGGDWDANVRGFNSSPDPDGFSRRWLSDGGSNWTNYGNPELDKCMREGRIYYDNAKRAEVYKRCQRIIFEDAYAGGLYIPLGNMAFRKEVKGLAVQAWYIDFREAWLDK